MDLELRISQYIDGELSGEEEAELHHMLAVSPEARALFREHLTLHTVARDERVLHRPTQSMRDDLFARLQAEEGMKPSAVVLASAGASTAVLSDAPTSSPVHRVAEDRPAIASQGDTRTEERRRRRRLIPILIPLLLCVIVGGVWYSGGFGSGDGSEEYVAAKTTVKNNAPAASSLSDRDYTERTETPEQAADDNTFALARPEESISSDASAVSSRVERKASSRSRAQADRSAASTDESFAMKAEEKRISHDVLGISSFGSDVNSDWDVQSERKDVRSTPPTDYTAIALGDREQNIAMSYDDVDFDASVSRDQMSYSASAPSSSEWLSQTVPIVASAPAAEPFGGVNQSAPQDWNSSMGWSVSNSIPLNEPVQANLYNSIEPATLNNVGVRSGKMADSATGLAMRPTLDNYYEIAATLEQNGLDADGDGKLIGNRSEPSNTGSRSINDNAVRLNALDVQNTWAVTTPEGKGMESVPSVMGEKEKFEASTVASDTVVAEAKSQSQNTAAIPATIKATKMSRSIEADVVESSSLADFPLDPATPRRINFFIGLDQSIGAMVSAVEVVLPRPTSSIPSFARGESIFPETRMTVGVDFDGGRQRAFAAVGAWAYDKRESFQSSSVSSPATGVNQVRTVVGAESSIAYEIWGGGGYRYSVEIADHWNAGAEVWGGIGANYVHAGAALPISYALQDNLRLELAPGLRYRVLHSQAESVTTGTSSNSFQERLTTPRDEKRVEASVGIGLILLLR